MSTSADTVLSPVRAPAIDAIARCRRAWRAFALTGLLGLLHVASAAVAGEGGHQFHVEGGDLGDALNAVAAQAGVQILYDASLVTGHLAPPLDGDYAVDEALARVLAGSGLSAVAATSNTYVLKRRLPPRHTPPPEAVVDSPEYSSTTELASIFVRGPGPQRTAAESAISITEIDREQIDASGYTTLFDLLRAQPGVEVANQPEAMASASSSAFKTGASGAAAVALRRLGAKNTLILVDGRRITGYGISALDTATVPDLTSIPLAIVDRVEILRDGASVIYGSDAVAGVINIVLRRDFTGSEIEAYTGISSRGDAASSRLSYRWSTNADNGTGAFVSIDLAHSDPLIGDQRDWYTLDQSSRGLADVRSPASYPGNFIYGGSQYVARDGCAPANLSADGVCLLDSAKYTTLLTGKSAGSLFARLTHPLGDAVLLHADLRAADVTQRQQSAPSTTQIENDASGPGEPDSLVYSFNDLGPVEETTRSKLVSLTAGATGHTGHWSWDADARFEENRVRDAIDHLILAHPADGVPIFDFSSPSVDPDSAAIAAPEVVRRGVSSLQALNGDFSGPAFDLPAGSAAIAGGVELRREGIQLDPDATLESGALANQTPEVGVSAHRPAAAAYAKIDMPVTAWLDAYAAGRFDKTRGFDGHFSPALGLSWSPAPSVALRATRYGGYRAPALSELHRFGASIATPAPELYYIPRELGPCAIQVIETPEQLGCELYRTSVSNPNLDAETSYTNALGFAWFPSQSFSLDVDIYDTLRNNEIADLPLEYALEHPDLYPGFLSRNAGGALVSINEMLVNIGHTRTRGVDFEAHWDVETAEAGRFKIGVGLNYLGDLEREVIPGMPAQQYAGFRSEPRVTAVTSLRWALGAWITGANLRYTGNYAYEDYAGAADTCPAYKATLGRCRTPSFTLVNLSLTYQGLAHWSISGYVNNVFDHQPRYYDEASAGYNAAFDDPVGRYYAVRAAYSF
ncbi:MAG TPA: TonB-dependent receptor [Rhodanobacteraceae bacterium]|nr:TonB-dependent receptor [Rhodanobacteraceae bacterium]